MRRRESSAPERLARWIPPCKFDFEARRACYTVDIEADLEHPFQALALHEIVLFGTLAGLRAGLPLVALFPLGRSNPRIGSAE